MKYDFSTDSLILYIENEIAMEFSVRVLQFKIKSSSILIDHK